MKGALQVARLRHAREFAGLSTADVALVLGLVPRLVTELEEGLFAVPPEVASENLKELFRALGMDADFVFGLTDRPQPRPRDERMSTGEFRRGVRMLDSASEAVEKAFGPG